MARAPKLDAALAGEVDFARGIIVESVPAGQVGEHLGATADGERLVTHRFAALLHGYAGWNWYVTLARVPRGKAPTVSEIGLLPGGGALLAPEWVPWADRVKPEELAQEQAAAAAEAAVGQGPADTGPSGAEHDGASAAGGQRAGQAGADQADEAGAGSDVADADDTGTDQAGSSEAGEAERTVGAAGGDQLHVDPVVADSAAAEVMGTIDTADTPDEVDDVVDDDAELIEAEAEAEAEAGAEAEAPGQEPGAGG